MEIYMGIMMLALGLCVGSFLNMAIYRLAIRYRLLRRQKAPRNDVGGRSYCDFCGRQLFWYENIPVISWLILDGKTKCCNKKLPVQYPLLELSMGVIFLITNYELRITNYWEIFILITYLVIASLLIFSLVFDLKWMILPDVTNLTLIAGALVLWFARYFGDWNYLFAGLGSILFFFILNRIKIRGSEAMGMGDVKYSLFMGLFLGWPNILVAVYVAFVIGALISVGLLLFRVVKRETPIPFGPFLILGTVVAKIWGDNLIKFFLGVSF